MRRRTRKHWLAIVPLWLLIGAAVNIGVAWTFAVKRERTDAILDTPGLSMRGTLTITRNLAEWPTAVPTDWPSTPTNSYTQHMLGSPEVHAWHEAVQGSTTRDYSVTFTQSGWPLPSLMGWHAIARMRTESSDEYAIDRSPQLTIPWPDAWWGNEHLILPRAMHLPIVPIWSGLLINTLIYAAFVALLWAAPRALRQLLRRRKGACTGCGYDRTGLPAAAVCPECATSVPLT